MAWGRWLAFLTPLAVVACGSEAAQPGATSENRPRPRPTVEWCAEPPEIHGDLRPVWVASIEGLISNTRLIVDQRGNAFLAGLTGPLDSMSGRQEGIVVAFDPDGRLLWKRSLQGVLEVRDLAVDRDGVVHVYVSDTFDDPSGSSAIAQVDRSGNAIKRISLSRSNRFYQARLAVSDGDGFVLADTTVVYGFDAEGLDRWSRFGQKTFVDQATFDGSGVLVVSGRYFDAFDWVSPPLVARGMGAFVAKLNADGAVLEAKIFPEQVPGALAVGGTRTFLSTVPSDRAFIGQTGAARLTVAALENGGAGTLQPAWSMGVDAAIGDLIPMLAPAPDGGVFAAGTLKFGGVDLGLGPLPPRGIFVARLDAAGQPVANAMFHGQFSDGSSIATDGQGNVFLSTMATGPFDFGAGAVESLRVAPGMTVAVVKISPQPAAVSNRRGCASAAPGAILERSSYASPVSMAISETHLAAATHTDVSLVPLPGGEPKFVAVGQDGIVGVALDRGVLYWAIGGTPPPNLSGGRDGRIVSLSLEPGATPKVLVDHQDGLQAIAVDDRRLVFSVGLVNNGSTVTLGKLMSVTLEGGPPSTLLSGLVASCPFALVGGETVAAASTETPGTARILRIAADGVATQLALTEWKVTGLAVDNATEGATIYLQEWSDAAGGWRVRSLPLAGGPATLVGNGRFSPRSGLVVAGEQLAFTFMDDFGMGLMQLPKAGGSPNAMLTGFRDVGGLAAHGNRLAWAQGDGENWKVMTGR